MLSLDSASDVKAWVSMLDNLNRFSTDAFPGELRAAAWLQTLGRIGLTCDLPASDRSPLYGSAAVSISSHASVFAKLHGSPQILSLIHI